MAKYELINPKPVSELPKDYKGSVFYLNSDGNTRQADLVFYAEDSSVYNQKINPSQMWGTGWLAVKPHIRRTTSHREDGILHVGFEIEGSELLYVFIGQGNEKILCNLITGGK